MMNGARDTENDARGVRLTVKPVNPDEMEMIPPLKNSLCQQHPQHDSVDPLQTRKRCFPQDVAATRLPLLLQNSNIPSPPKKIACLNPIAETRAGDPVATHRLSQIKALTPLLIDAKQTNDHRLDEPAQRHTKEALITTSKPSNVTKEETHSTQKQTHSLHQPQPTTTTGQTQNKSLGRLAGDELVIWQNSWRKIMKESTVYFEGVSEYNPLQTSEFRRASRYLKLVGCTIAPFFDNDVTIIVSRRQYNASREYLPTDIFCNVSHLKIKVWDYNKVFRFLKNLGVNTDAKLANVTSTTANEKALEETAKEDDKHLYNLLREEKIYGTNDRDLNAKRDDLHYLERNYLYVYDLSQNARPIAIREWHEGSFPVLNLTMDGKCPFISEPMDSNSERKKLRRIQKFITTQSYRSLLKRVTQDMVRRIKNNNSASLKTTTACRKSPTPTNTASGECDETIVQSTSSLSKPELVEQSVEKGTTERISEQAAGLRPAITSTNSFKEPHMLATLIRNSSCINPLNPHTNTNAGDMMASGYNGASNATNFSMDASLNSAAAQGNGLGPLVSQVPSRNLTHLKRRIIIKKQQQTAGATDARKAGKDLVPGYCENCRVKYDHFDEHIRSNRHRNFACDDENFRDIDKLIAMIGESKALGHITSNGDYRYSY